MLHRKTRSEQLKFVEVFTIYLNKLITSKTLHNRYKTNWYYYLDSTASLRAVCCMDLNEFVTKNGVL